MTTVPLGENPYLYQGGPTVPLRQQQTGTYAADSLGNRVFYTPEGRLPNSTLAPGLAPTAGQLARQSLSGAGLAGAAIGGGIGAAQAYNQGAGLFEGLGVGLGGVAGSVGGQVAGFAGGSAAGGAIGSAVPGVGTVAGAGAGGVVGAVGGGLAGGAVGGAVGGGIGRAVDGFFWPDPAEPGVGIPPQPGAATPRPGGEEYPGQFPPAAAGAGPVVVPGDPIYGPAPFTGGQMPGILYRASGRLEFDRVWCDGSLTVPWSIEFLSEFNILGPVSNARLEYSNPGLCGPRNLALLITQGDGSTRAIAQDNDVSFRTKEKGTFTLSFERAGGLPDTGGNPPAPQTGSTTPERSPNPYRPNGTDGAGRPRAVPAAPNARPTAPAPNSPWPERSPAPVPDTAPIGAGSPFAAPDAPPNFAPAPASPQPDTDPLAPTQPQQPLDPLNPTGPSRPLQPDQEGKRTAQPFFIPVPIPTGSINPPGFINPDPPITVPVGLRQPATTPTGTAIDLTTPGEITTTNPNTRPQIEPVQQPARIEEGKCCIPPANPEIIKRLEQIKSGIGFDGMPVSVPDQIAKQNPSQLQIGSLAELHLWQVQQLDGVMGQWPQQIPIPTPAGTVNVGMPNMAEAVAELVGMMVSQQVTATQILNTTSRTLAQAGSATQQAHLAHLTAKANAEFLGFESRPSVVDMPLAYTPGQDPFDGLLNESVAKVRGFENADGQDLKSILAELLQAAAIIRAVYWRRLDPKGDLKTQIRQNIRGQGDFVDEAAAGGGQGEDWEAYLRDVEAGFRSATGDDNPYGRPPGEGPQIRDRSPKKDR
ncbi:hypothetical protein [Nodosilinea sp. E11]|uniref:hypothetical protein n=1 Tax=Nodosilinea sp. E11 TaxID=3037479 RepID=UPI002934F7DE|nr:hypothetical protein [Nodosilinea sp. E11]WOD37368.1 hypothetical protein RRF56_02625 [Nodosilinea sp. E11]WOD37930.1 hypothetical protein RRF56_17090 [Nodosilinea sp. E11]